MKNKALFTALASAGLLLGSSVAMAKDLVVATSASLGSLQYNTTKQFTDVANQMFADADLDYNLKFFGAGQLGKDKDVQQKLKLGTVDAALLTSTLPTHVPQMALFELPFLIKDREHIAKLEEEIFWSQIAPFAEKKGYKVIGFWENGFRHITNNVQPINTPDDLDGLKMRTPNSSWRVKMFRNWSANPTPMSFGDVFIGLQTGVIDGQENPFTNIYAAKLHEVQKYLTISNHVYTPAYMTVSPRHFAKHPQQVQDIMVAAAKAAQQWCYEQAVKAENELKDKLVAGGMQLNVADRQAFVDASAAIYDEFNKSVEGGEDILSQALALAK